MTPGRLPAALLVVTVLVCHGLFGAAHQTFTPATGTHGHHAPVHTQATDPGENHDGHQTGHHEAGHLAGSAEYAAVLVTVLLGAALVLLLSTIHLRDTAPMLQPAGRRFRVTPAGLHPTRGPTLPALQVFRL